MTVAELIAKLQEFDADLPVVFDPNDVDFIPVKSVSRVSVFEDDNSFAVLNWHDDNDA